MAVAAPKRLRGGLRRRSHFKPASGLQHPGVVVWFLGSLSLRELGAVSCLGVMA
jgi:hypothetical protein